MNSKSWIRATGIAAMGALLILAAAACNSSSSGGSVTTPPPPGGGSSNLVASASTPSDGDGTLTATGTITVNNGGSGFDEVNLSQTLGSTGHEVVVTWDTSTHAINSVQHIWGSTTPGSPTSGFTQCDPSGTACDPSKIAIDFAGNKVTFTNLTLTDAFGGTAVSTLDGTLVW